jgi:hypothetical protein
MAPLSAPTRPQDVPMQTCPCHNLCYTLAPNCDVCRSQNHSKRHPGTPAEVAFVVSPESEFPMTVAELIAKLQTAPNLNADVYIERDEYGTDRQFDVYFGAVGEWDSTTKRGVDNPAVILTPYGGHEDKVRL